MCHRSNEKKPSCGWVWTKTIIKGCRSLQSSDGSNNVIGDYWPVVDVVVDCVCPVAGVSRNSSKLFTRTRCRFCRIFTYRCRIVFNRQGKTDRVRIKMINEINVGQPNKPVTWFEHSNSKAKEAKQNNNEAKWQRNWRTSSPTYCIVYVYMQVCTRACVGCSSVSQKR